MKKKIAVVCGGYSGESVVSMKSADMIMRHIDRNLYEPLKVILTKNRIYAETPSGEVDADLNDFTFSTEGEKYKPDLCFIIIHGTPGEDGKLQGYFELINMPYASGGVFNTALTFNKLFTTRLLNQMGYNAAKGFLLNSKEEFNVLAIEAVLQYPVIVKPNEGGSSLGISIARSNSDLEDSVDLAFGAGKSVLIEEFIKGKEFSCGAISSTAGVIPLEVTEIETEKEFFDYKAKYEYDKTREITPARLELKLYEKCQRLTKEIFERFECSCFARIDFILRDGEFYVIEINTLPGMTDKSILPQQAEAKGIGKTELISTIIEYAFKKSGANNR